MYSIPWHANRGRKHCSFALEMVLSFSIIFSSGVWLSLRPCRSASSPWHSSYKRCCLTARAHLLPCCKSHYMWSFGPNSQHPAAPTLRTHPGTRLPKHLKPIPPPTVAGSDVHVYTQCEMQLKGNLTQPEVNRLQISVFRPRKASVPGIFFPRKQFHRSRGQAAQHIDPQRHVPSQGCCCH